MVNGGGQMCSFAVYITCVGLEAVCVKTAENCSSEERLVKYKVKQEMNSDTTSLGNGRNLSPRGLYIINMFWVGNFKNLTKVIGLKVSLSVMARQSQTIFFYLALVLFFYILKKKSYCDLRTDLTFFSWYQFTSVSSSRYTKGLGNLSSFRNRMYGCEK